MFQIGQQIIYGSNGVCRIEDIVLRENQMLGEPQQVYIMRLASGLTSYVPVESSVFMRALVSPEEAKAVIREFPAITTKSFPATNSKALADLYRSILSRHDPRQTLCLYKSLRAKIDRALENGKRPGAMDERFAAAAIQEVADEFAAVLCVPPETVESELLTA